MKIMIFADIHKDWCQLRSIIARNDIDLFICAGDWCNYRSDIVIANDRSKYQAAVEKGIEIMAQCEKPLWVLPGNNEGSGELKIAESNDLVVLHEKVLEYGGLVIGGVGYITPSGLETYEKEEEYFELVLESFKTFKKLDIFVSHSPPKNTKLDIIEMPAKDFDLGKIKGQHTGCQAIKEFIIEQQPRYSFHAHMHEHEGKREKLGRTMCHLIGKKGYILEI